MTQTLITAIIGVATVVGAYLAARMQRPKIEAEATNILTGAATSLVADLRKELERLNDRLEDEIQHRYNVDKQLQTALAALRRMESWAKILHAEVLENGGTPTSLEKVK